MHITHTHTSYHIISLIYLSCQILATTQNAPNDTSPSVSQTTDAHMHEDSVDRPDSPILKKRNRRPVVYYSDEDETNVPGILCELYSLYIHGYTLIKHIQFGKHTE